MPRYHHITEVLRDLETDIVELPARQTEIHQVSPIPPTIGVDELWRRASSAYDDNYVNDADRYCRYLLEIQPGQIEARRLLEMLQSRRAQATSIYERIDRILDSVSLTEPAHLFKAATEIYPGHPSEALFLERLMDRYERFESYRQAGQEACVAGIYPLALIHFKEAAKLHPGMKCMPIIGVLEDMVRSGGYADFDTRPLPQYQTAASIGLREDPRDTRIVSHRQLGPASAASMSNPCIPTVEANTGGGGRGNRRTIGPFKRFCARYGGDPVIAICHPLACLAFGSFVFLIALDVLGFSFAKQAFAGIQEWLRSWAH